VFAELGGADFHGRIDRIEHFTGAMAAKRAPERPCLPY